MSEILSKIDVNSTIKYSTALAIILGMKLFSPIISRIIILVFHKLLKVETKVTESGFYGPLKFLITVIGFGLAILYLQLPEGIVNLYYRIFKILLILIIAKALTNCLTPDSTFFTKLETSTKFNGNEALNSFIAKILKGIIYITAAFIILADMNINLGGLVAGLGIGSAALALAAQDFVKSLIGGFAIISDKTFEIGDFIEIGLYSGTVIDITFRSTKVRAVNNEIISIPNSVIVTEYVKNGSKIENRRIETRLRIGLDTQSEKITDCINKLKTLLKSNDAVLEETVTVVFEKIEPDANIILIALFLNTTDYNEYLKIKQNIYCDILELLEKENIELVYPTQKVYMKTI